MAVGTALMFASGAYSAYSSIQGANAQAKNIERQAQYNSEVYGQQAEMIKEKQKIQDYQFNRDAARARGTIINRTAGKGFMLSGSPLAILADNESQMQFDKAIQDYNTNIERNYAMSGATASREAGFQQSRLAKFTGYSNAFSTMLSTGYMAGRL